MPKQEKIAIIECDQDIYVAIATTLQHSIVGQKIFYSDSLADLVNRYCPELYDIADEAGFIFVPSTDKDELTSNPPSIWFDVIRKPDDSELTN